ncbi:MAG: hypothetical protein M0R76_05760 [Proteobacteria bacterium]|nr:hypothetical protein [Pseudomonadota bacterium]
MKNRIWIWALVGAAIALGSCDSEVADTYDFDVVWTLGGSSDCRISFQGETIDIENIHIRMYKSKDDALAERNPTDDIVVPCEQKETTLRRLEGRKYWMLTQGIGTIDDQELPLCDDLSEVRISANNLHERISLTQSEGEIDIIWGFASTLTCGFNKPNEVATIEIFSAESDEVPCTDGHYLISNIIANDYSVTLNAKNANGDVIGTVKTESPFLVLPGQRYDARLIFE